MVASNKQVQPAQPRTELCDFPQVMTVAEVIEFTRLGRGTVYEALRTGNIPSLKVGRNIRVSRNALAVWLDGEQPSQSTDVIQMRHGK